MLRRPFLVVCAALLVVAVIQTPSASSVEARPPAGPAPEGRRTFGNFLRAVAVDPDGNVYVTGSRHEHMILRKYSPTGAILWTRAWSPNDAWAAGRGLAIGGGGSVYLAGGVGVAGYEGGAWFIRKYSSSGELLWRRATPDWREGATTAISGIAVGGRRVVVSGFDHGCCGESFWHDGWVRAYGYDGTLAWVKDFEPPFLSRTIDAANDVAVNAHGSAFVVGWVSRRHQLESDRTEPERSEHDIVLQRLDRSGRLVWTRVLDDKQKRDRDEALAVDLLDGRLAVAGTIWLGEHVGRAWLASFTTGGRLDWQRAWSTERRQAIPADVAFDGSGISVVGDRIRRHGCSLFLRRFTSGGAALWESQVEDRPQVSGSGVDARADAEVFVVGSGSTRQRTDGYVWRFGI